MARRVRRYSRHTRSDCRSHHVGRHRPPLGAPNRRRLHGNGTEDHRQASDDIRADFSPLFRDNAHALRRTLALLRMVQSGAVGFHALDSDRMAGPQPQAVYDHIAACNVHDMRHRDIHILCSRGIRRADRNSVRLQVQLRTFAWSGYMRHNTAHMAFRPSARGHENHRSIPRTRMTPDRR